MLKDNADLNSAGADGVRTDVVKEPVTYTKTGETVAVEQSTGAGIEFEV